MAVYTKINKESISYINKIFDIEKFVSFQGIKQGIENTNYLLKSKNRKYILTIFEKRVKDKELPFFMQLMENLNISKINCPKPIKNKKGNYLFKLKNKKACVVTFLEGKDKKNLNIKNCYEIGKIVAHIHSITKNIKLKRKNSMGINNLNPLQIHILPHLLCYSIFNFLKGIMKRERPGAVYKRMGHYINSKYTLPHESCKSFPSAHSGLAFSLSTAIAMEMNASKNPTFFNFPVKQIFMRHVITFIAFFISFCVKF